MFAFSGTLLTWHCLVWFYSSYIILVWYGNIEESIVPLCLASSRTNPESTIGVWNGSVNCIQLYHAGKKTLKRTKRLVHYSGVNIIESVSSKSVESMGFQRASNIFKSRESYLGSTGQALKNSGCNSWPAARPQRNILPANDLVRGGHTLENLTPMSWANIPLVVWVPYSYVITPNHRKHVIFRQVFQGYKAVGSS